MTSLRGISLPLCIAAAFTCADARADDYRFELEPAAGHLTIEQDDSPDVDLDQVGVGGTYYFKPVPTDGLPLAEAAFLNRSSYLGAEAVRSELGDEKIDIFRASVGYYIPDTMFFARLGYTYLDDFSPGDQSRFDGTFGITPFDGLLVSTDFDEDGWDPNATAKYVGMFGNGHWYAASIRVVDPDDDDIIVGADFDYFFDPTFSVGVGADSDFDTLEVRTENFFTPGFSLGGRAFFTDAGDGFAASVKWRF